MRFDVWTSTACAALFAACAFFLPAPSRAAEFSNDQKAEIGKIVKEYLPVSYTHLTCTLL